MRIHHIVSILAFCLMLMLFSLTAIQYSIPQTIRQSDVEARSDVIKRSVSTMNITRKRENIFFLKAHKCGSSTVQNILLRYGRDNNLLFLLPSEFQGNYIGNPKLFNSKLIDESVRSVDNTYNVFTHHTRYNSKELKKVMKPNAAFVTILRDPATLFESMYSFYRMQKRLNVTFKEFLEDTDKYEEVLSARYNTRFGRNQMCFDLGFEDHLFSSEYVDDFIKMIEHDFDLVMMSEHMEASLILLADLMGWPLHHIRFLNNNVREVITKANLTEGDKRKLRKFNYADTKLYNYFLEVFKSKIKAYGSDKMKDQVLELISMNHDLFHLCVDQVDTSGYGRTLSYSIKDGAPKECFYAGKTELSFTKQLRVEQIYKMQQLRKVDNLMRTDSSNFSNISR